MEVWNSVNTDPTNFSAHRFLSDSYSALPRHEIARVSELLQAQLLQPTNITPIQPQLAESNLFLISSQGPSAVGFNTFNPLFNRNQATAQLGGLLGSNETWAGEGIVSGIYDKLSFSAGYTHFETDGYRINNDQKDDIVNIFAQYEINYKTSIQAEYRYRDTDRGDTELRFFADDFFPDLREEQEKQNIRLGLRHAFTPGSVLIGNFAYNKADESFSATALIDPNFTGFPPPPIEDNINIDLAEEAVTGEVQHLFRSNYINTVAGAGYFDIDQEYQTREIVTYPGNPGLGIPEIPLADIPGVINADTRHFNLYLYSYLKPLQNLTFTVGASGDFFDLDEKEFDDQDLKEDQFNPKFVVVWNLPYGTTLRGAVFRTFTRTLTTDQTLEPTQVAGFNQFFDDPDATSSWAYGAAVDQKFTQSIYGGLSFTYRDLDVPFFDQPTLGAPFELTEADWKEYIGRAYFYWTPHKWLAFTTEYLYEVFDRDDPIDESVKDVKTHRVPIGLNFFHSSGLNIGLKGTYFNQDGTFWNRAALAPSPLEDGSDTFWLFDAAVSYRLPKRYGFVTLGVANITDEQFEFVDTDINNPSIQPERTFYGKVTLSF